MSIFIIGLCIGLCLAFAGGITLLRVAFARISERDFTDSVDPSLKNLFHTLVFIQDKIFSALFIAYGFFTASALILITHFLLNGLNDWQIALHCVLLPCFLLIVTDLLPRAYILHQPMDFIFQLLPWIKRIAMVFSLPATVLVKITHLSKRTFCPLAQITNTFEFYPSVSRYYQAENQDQSPEKQDYLIQQSLGRFASMPVSQMMIPVRKLKLMDAALEMDELLTQAFETNAKRVLLYQDQPENIIGILHVSLLMKSFCLAEGDKDATDITSAISEAVFIAPDKPVLAQLQDFSTQQTQFALVRDGQDYIKGAIDLETILDALASDLKQKAV